MALRSSAAWAAGTQIAALTEPIGNWVVTLQWVMGIVATLLIMWGGILAIQREGAGIVIIMFGLIVVAFVVKAPDIVASFGQQRAIAADLIPVVITARQQVLDALQTWFVNWAWMYGAVEGIRRGRAA